MVGNHKRTCGSTSWIIAVGGAIGALIGMSGIILNLWNDAVAIYFGLAGIWVAGVILRRLTRESD